MYKNNFKKMQIFVRGQFFEIKERKKQFQTKITETFRVLENTYFPMRKKNVTV